MENLTFIRDGRAGLVGKNSVMTFEASAIAPTGQPAKVETKGEKKYDPDAGTKDWAAWGASDDWPLVVLRDKMSKISVFKRALSMTGDLHYGSGIGWAKKDAAGKIVPVALPAFDEFTRQIHFQYNKEHSKLIDSLQTFFWGAVEVILEKNSNKIFSLQTLDTAYCRLGKRKNGRISKLYFDMDFGDGVVTKPAEIDVFDPLNPYAKKKFVVIFTFDTFGRNYYPEPYWNSTNLNGWADIAIEVPKLIRYIYKNQITIKHHIHYPQSVIRYECREWDEMTTEKKKAWLMDRQAAIESSLVGGENAGKTVISSYSNIDEKVLIEPIANLLNNVNDLPNNVAANSEILFSIGLDPALVGLNMPGGKDLNGSGGSDKRVGMNITQATLFREREVSLYLPRLVAFFNGYDKNIFPIYKDIDVSQTLDENKTGKEEQIKG